MKNRLKISILVAMLLCSMVAWSQNSTANRTLKLPKQKSKLQQLYLECINDSVTTKYNVGGPLYVDKKEVLLNLSMLKTHNPKYKTSSFNMIVFDVLEKAIVEPSDENKFTENQIKQIRRLSRGKRFYISDIEMRDTSGKPYSFPYSIEILVESRTILSASHDIDDPLLYIEFANTDGYHTKTHISKEELLTATTLNTYNPKYKVIDFRLYCFDCPGHTSFYFSDGNKFSGQQLNYIKRLAKGNIFYISMIKMQDNSGNEFIFPYTMMVVVD